MGLLATKLHQVLGGGLKKLILSASSEIKSMVNNIKILFYKAEYLNSTKLFTQGTDYSTGPQLEFKYYKGNS